MAGRKAERRVSTLHTTCAVAPREQRMKGKMDGQKMSIENEQRGRRRTVRERDI